MTETTFEALADEYWDTYMRSAPHFATTIGDHRFDDRLGPVSADEVRRTRDGFASIRDRVAAVDTEDTLGAEVLRVVAGNYVKMIDSGVYVAPINPYLGVHSVLPSFTSRAAAQTPEHAEMLLTRVRSIPAHLDEVAEQQRADLAGGITPSETNVARVLDQLEAQARAPLDDDPFVTITAPPDWDGEETWRENLRHAVETGIRPALARYRDFLAEHAGPVARSDDRPGILGIPDGRDRYALLVEVFTSLGLDPDEVHRIGVEAVERLRGRFSAIGSDALGTSEADEVIRRLREDPDLRYDTEDEMLDHARRTIERAWEGVRPHFGVMPKNPCRVQPAPAALAPSMPPAYYGVGAPDGSRPGTYYLNTHEPSTRTRFDAEAIAFHEAIPGHHFDRTLASELTDIHIFRRFNVEVAHAEGWGLYAERLADEIGLYSGPIDRLGQVSSEIWRAVRLVLDTGIHHLGWSRAHAIDYFRANTPLSLATIEVETDRYIAMPGQALAYLIGQREILRLREKAKTVLGDDFSLPAFHDVVLTNGSVPLSVLGGLVDDWIESA